MAENGERRSRAKHACRQCRDRRVRCDVTVHHPCSNCQADKTNCEILPSRRGRPVRTKHPGNNESVDPTNHLTTTNDEVAAPPADLPTNHGEPPPPDTQSEGGVSGGVSGALFATPGSLRSLFYGESNFLNLLPGKFAPNTRTRVCSKATTPHPITPASSNAQMNGTVPSSSATTDQANDTIPSEADALHFPDIQSILPVVKTYFQWFHPCFPILDSQEIVAKLRSANFSPLLLNAMLSVGCTYCDEQAIFDMGFRERADAKTSFYNQAKLLFHADHEKDPITLIQALFLMSFWRAGPDDFRDVRFWLGTVITIAESIGMHRSERYTTVDPRQACMRRRIWWSIYVRERQSAVALGLPTRIRDVDCDIEPLRRPDLEQDNDENGDEVCGVIQQEHIVYVLKMVGIAHILGRIIDSKFVPVGVSGDSGKVRELDNLLDDWLSDLPESMRDPGRAQGSVFTCLLHLAYNHLRILIHRAGFLGNTDKGDKQVVLLAACQISRIAEDMLTQKTVRYGQMHLITSFFAALCIHSISTKSSDSVVSKLSEHRAEVCLLALRELNNYWRINNNVLDLFLEYQDERIARKLRVDTSGPNTTAVQQATNVSTASENLSSLPTSNPWNSVYFPLGQTADLFEGQFLNFVQSGSVPQNGTSQGLESFLDPLLFFSDAAMDSSDQVL